MRSPFPDQWCPSFVLDSSRFSLDSATKEWVAFLSMATEGVPERFREVVPGFPGQTPLVLQPALHLLLLLALQGHLSVRFATAAFFGPNGKFFCLSQPQHKIQFRSKNKRGENAPKACMPAASLGNYKPIPGVNCSFPPSDAGSTSHAL